MTCVLPDFGITMRHANSHAKSGELGLTTTIMYYDFALHIIDDMALLLGYFDVCPEQLPPLVLLVYERAKLLQSYFQV